MNVAPSPPPPVQMVPATAVGPKDFIGMIPAIMFIFTIVGGGAIALNKITDLAGQLDKSNLRQEAFATNVLQRIETINSSVVTLLQMDRRVAELERGLRENTIGDVDQSREADRLRTAQALDHQLLSGIADQVNKIGDQTNGRLPRGNGR